MREQTSRQSSPASNHTGGPSLESPPDVVGSEDIHLRNYDYQWGYDIVVEVVEPTGDAVFEKRYYLQPGRVESELDAIPAGEYEIRAVLDGQERSEITGRIGPGLDGTAVIEVGNGALSLTQGLTN